MMLAVQDLEAGYGQSQVLFGMSLEIGAGEVATLIGRNGMGKTTTVRAVMGLLPTQRGTVLFEGKPITHVPAHRIARMGIGLVPEGRQIFPNLSVRENLIAMAANRLGVGNPWTLGRILQLFPRLGERLNHMGNQLSGGEQQMLAIGRALMTNPKLLILDEATEGLAPLVREEIWNCLGELKSLGQSILIIDKHVEKLLSIAESHYVIEKGRVVFHGNSDDFRKHPEIRERYIGV